MAVLAEPVDSLYKDLRPLSGIQNLIRERQENRAT
jgi:hypothetical protein